MARNSVPQVFDKNMKRLAFLENAMDVAYELPLNALWTASFALPADDPKNEYCSSLNYVEIFDGETRVDLFRIIGEDFERTDNAVKVYTCEHVLATLMNDILFQYHQIGGVNVRTPQVINYILAQQTTERWQLNTCDFNKRFEYNFENENLLSAVFAVANCFDTEYQWTWDTTTYPWLLNLVDVGSSTENIDCEIRYKKNMVGVQRTKDDTQIANRIYALGYGEGVNQLTIKSANSGIPYVEDGVSQSQYGLCPTVLVDTRFEQAENLKAYALQVLERLKDPYVSYDVTAVDLFRINGDDYGRFLPGRVVRVIDTEDGISLRTKIVNVSKKDLRGDPAAITVTLANKEQSVADSISELQNRTRINETYAQGATNLLMQNFSDNADAGHPATFKVMIPAETVRINKMLLSVEFEAFRGYSTAVSSTEINLTSTNSGGGSTKTSDSTSITKSSTDADNDITSSSYGTHNHGIPSGTRLATVSGQGSTTVTGDVGFVWSGAHDHGSHTHDVSIPSHKHSITMPAHSHDMEFGIYEGETATSAAIIVDGNVMPTVTDYSSVNIIPYLSKDSAGKILRGTWHTVEIKPNKQSRIVAALFTQLFTNSRGGGDF